MESFYCTQYDNKQKQLTITYTEWLARYIINIVFVKCIGSMRFELELRWQTLLFSFGFCLFMPFLVLSFFSSMLFASHCFYLSHYLTHLTNAKICFYSIYFRCFGGLFRSNFSSSVVCRVYGTNHLLNWGFFPIRKTLFNTRRRMYFAILTLSISIDFNRHTNFILVQSIYATRWRWCRWISMCVGLLFKRKMWMTAGIGWIYFYQKTNEIFRN